MEEIKIQEISTPKLRPTNSWVMNYLRVKVNECERTGIFCSKYDASDRMRYVIEWCGISVAENVG